MKKIVIVARNLLVAGAENMVSQLVSNINQDEYDVTLIITTNKYNNFLEERVEKSGVKIIYLGKKYSKGFDFSKITAFFKMWTVLRKIRPQLIHTHLSATIYTFPYVLFHKVILLHTVHNLPEKEIPKITQFLLSILIKLKKAIPIAISDIIAKRISAHYKIGKENVPVIYNPVDLREFGIQQNKNKLDGNITITTVGRLTYQKNHKMLIEAFHLAKKKIKSMRLLIVGEGELRDELEKQVESKKLNNSIYFLGERNDIPEILNNTDIFVLSSDFEGLPLSLLEAMASGLPIIATRVGGVPDIITHSRNGLLVEKNDVEGLAEAIVNLTNNKSLRVKIGMNNIEDSKKYDVETMVNKYEELYRKLLF